MSRFVELHLGLGTLAEVERALRALRLPVECTGEPLLLRGGLECGDVPVELRLLAGTCDSVEDFGFVADASGEATLVCGEPDRSRLEQRLVTPLRAELARAKLGADPSLVVDAVHTLADGTVRVRVRPR